jgi:hypothetical protein
MATTAERIAVVETQVRNLDEAKDIILNHVNGKKIKDTDKQIITMNINELKNINAVHRYVANSLLKYEGLGVN